MSASRARCAYNPRAPRVAPKVALKTGHDLMLALQAKAQGLYQARFDPPAPLLEHRELGYVRAERAEALSILMAMFIDRADWRSLKIGQWFGGQIVHRNTVEEDCRDAGLAQDRLERALQDAHAAGWLHSHQPREKKKDEAGNPIWVGFTAHRKLTHKFLEDMDLGGRRTFLLRQTQDAEKRQRREQEIAADKETRASRRSDVWQTMISADRDRFERRTWAVHNEHPDWDPDQVDAAVIAEFARPPPKQ